MARELPVVAAGKKAAGMHKHGTGAALPMRCCRVTCPFAISHGEFPGAYDISAEVFLDRIGVGMEGCFACAVRCKKVVSAETPYKLDPDYGGPEYESVGSLGSCCGVDDVVAISKATELCNAYSLDTIGTGVTIAFAMECFENGLLTLEDTDGIDLRFGNGDAVIQMVEKIAKREGIGALLAEGTKRAAAKIGRGAERFAMEVKGQEYPMHEPRFKRGLAIGYAISPTGADHCHALHDAGLMAATEEGFLGNATLRSMGILEPVDIENLGPEKVRATLYNTIGQITNNCLPMCNFVPWSMDERVKLVRAATGWDVSAFELFKVGQRAMTLARVYNMREGFTAEDDHLAERSYGPTTGGALADGGIDREELREAMQTYYGMMGWDEETGEPRPSTLDELGVSWAKEYLPRK